jgi:hypothetical protein
MNVVLHIRRATATPAGAVPIQTFGSVIDPEPEAKSRPGVNDLAEPPSHLHNFAAE